MKVVKLADVVEFNPEKLKKVSLFDTEISSVIYTV